VLKLLPAEGPVLLGLSKTDQLKDRRQLLPFMDQVRELHDFAEIVPFSAMRAASLRQLIKAIRAHLPEGEPVYDADTITDRSERFLAAEMIREKLFHALGEELPYSATVVIEKFEEEGALRRIHASVIVDKDSQKAIVIGAKGERLKSIATRARHDMEKLFGGKVFLEVWVRVKHGWAHDARSLRALGYD
jgi:GTPase